VVRATPSKDELVNELQAPGRLDKGAIEQILGRIAQPGETGGQYVLVPTDQFNRLLKQTRRPGEIETLGRMLNGAFRMAVQPQFKWLAGNFIEPYFVRLPLSGSGAFIPGLLVDLRAANKALKGMEQSGDPLQ